MKKCLMKRSANTSLFSAKIYPFLEELRERFQSPNMYANLEKLIMRMPDAKEMLTKRREMMKMWMEKRAEMAKRAV